MENQSEIFATHLNVKRNDENLINNFIQAITQITTSQTIDCLFNGHLHLYDSNYNISIRIVNI